jgi:hypothetical protein
MSVFNRVGFSGAVSETLEIGTTALGQQADMLNLTEPPVSAMLAYQTSVPNPVGSSWSVRSLTRVMVPEDGTTTAFLRTGFEIVFEVDTTQDYQLFVADVGNSPIDGDIDLRDLTINDVLFTAVFDDITGGFTTPLTLEAGHLYRFSGSRAGSAPPFPDASPNVDASFAFRLNVVPEPSTFVSLGVGTVALLGTALRRRAFRITSGPGSIAAR